MTSVKQPCEIGKCDWCDAEDVYVKPGYDSWGTHVADQCFFGCNDPRNFPDVMSEDISVLQVEKIDHIECYESIWSASLSINGMPRTIRLTRYNAETDENLRAAIASCRNSEEIIRLNCCIFHN